VVVSPSNRHISSFIRSPGNTHILASNRKIGPLASSRASTEQRWGLPQRPKSVRYEAAAPTIACWLSPSLRCSPPHCPIAESHRPLIQHPVCTVLLNSSTNSSDRLIPSSRAVSVNEWFTAPRPGEFPSPATNPGDGRPPVWDCWSKPKRPERDSNSLFNPAPAGGSSYLPAVPLGKASLLAPTPEAGGTFCVHILPPNFHSQHSALFHRFY